MILGFTGTRNGLTDAQWSKLRDTLYQFRPLPEVHHGDCIGADAQFQELALSVSCYVKTVIHPPKNSRARAFCPLGSHDELLPAKSYLDRNRDIVDACELLIACPAEMTEQPRGGTWATVRMARKAKKRLLIIFPDGSTQEENSDG